MFPVKSLTFIVFRNRNVTLNSTRSIIIKVIYEIFKTFINIYYRNVDVYAIIIINLMRFFRKKLSYQIAYYLPTEVHHVLLSNIYDVYYTYIRGISINSLFSYLNISPLLHPVFMYVHNKIKQ